MRPKRKLAMSDESGAPASKAPRGRDAEKLVAELGAHDTLNSATALTTRLLERLRHLDFHCYEGMPFEQAVPHLIRGPVSDAGRLLNETMRLVRSLPRLVGAAEPVLVEDDEARPEPERAADLGASEGAPAPFQPGLGQAVSQDLDAALIAIQSTGWQAQGPTTRAQLESYATLCGRTVMSLKEALDELRDARRERAKWGLIAAGEEARRKARKALQVTCYLAMRLMGVADAAKHFAKEPTELQTSLWVRSALMAFVTDMQTLGLAGTPLDGANLGVHLRDVRIRMLQLFADAHYSELRAPDRYNVQQLFGALCKWLDKTWDDFAQARALMGQAEILVEALACINSRDLLVEHDRQLCRQAKTKLGLLLDDPALEAPTSALYKSFVDTLELLTRVRFRSAALDDVVQGQLVELKPAGLERSALKAAGAAKIAAAPTRPNPAEFAPRVKRVTDALDAVRFDQGAGARAATSDGIKPSGA
jgi:hypothetical protein